MVLTTDVTEEVGNALANEIAKISNCKVTFQKETFQFILSVPQIGQDCAFSNYAFDGELENETPMDYCNRLKLL